MTAMIISWDAFPPMMTVSLFCVWIPVSSLNKDCQHFLMV